MPTSNPSACAVMLANGRPDMVARAVKSFRAQTYEPKLLLILDSGRTPSCDIPMLIFDVSEILGNIYQQCESTSIGALRNEANKRAAELTECDIIVHWDSDDWSHPNRIAEQVALLQSSGAECVGYSEMLFWVSSREAHFYGHGYTPGIVYCACGKAWPRTYGRCDKCKAAPPDAEAWLYRSSLPNYSIGTSMCYWRETWDRTPFPDYSEGCDDLYWFNGDKKSGVKPVKIESVSSVPRRLNQSERDEYARVVKQYYPDEVPANLKLPDESPRMIASIHGGNTCAAIKPGVEWTRVADWDDFARGAMKL